MHSPSMCGKNGGGAAKTQAAGRGRYRDRIKLVDFGIPTSTALGTSSRRELIFGSISFPGHAGARYNDATQACSKKRRRCVGREVSMPTTPQRGDFVRV